MTLALKSSESVDHRIPRRDLRSWGRVLLSGCALLAVSACSASTLSVIESGEPSSDLPHEVIDAAGVDADSLRELGSSDQAQYFVAWKDDDSLNTADQRPCLIAVQEEDEFSVGCGTQGQDVLVELQSADIGERSILVADDADVEGFVEDGWTQISENLLVR